MSDYTFAEGVETMKEKYRVISPTTMMAPLPVVMVTCAEGEKPEKVNVFTVAWTGIVNTKPPMASISVKPERLSYQFIVSSGEFVINLVDRGLVRAADYCGVKSGREVDKLTAAGISIRKMSGVERTPAIDGAPVSLSCRIRQQLPLGSHDLFLAEITGVEVRDDLFDEDGSLHLERAGLVCYSHGLYHDVGRVLGFFGYSIAREETLKRRMKPYRSNTVRRHHD